jgi:hypothetical protein
MIKQAGFDEKAKGLMWAECVRTATMIECCLTENNGVSPRQKLFNDSPKWFDLRIFGEMAVITEHSGGIRGKLDDRDKLRCLSDIRTIRENLSTC